MDSVSNGIHTMRDLVSFYRILRPQYFSDSKVVYEIPLTRELFDTQLALLSTKKMQSEFENFVVACACRLITPNIKPQTGPDGGGDGKVDAETYAVSADISDKWFVDDEGASGDEKWAFAISCKKSWKPKVESDVEKAVGTNRGYTRVLFFSNQNIKSSTRADVEKDLSDKYGVKVEIFDGLWCANAVFIHGCIDVALSYLNFSDEYKRKKEIVGPIDSKRKDRLAEIEKGILRSIEGLDTDYVDELHETCILSRGLELPRTETEGRFKRALRGCEHHGTSQQTFNIIYDRAWTSFFWFEDVDAMAEDYFQLKEFVKDNPSVIRLEKTTNLLTNMMNAARSGLYDVEVVRSEVAFFKAFVEELKQLDKPSSLLYLQLYMAEQRLISNLVAGKPIDDDIDALRPLLLKAPYHLEISFEAQYNVINILNEVIEDNDKYDDLLDELTAILRETHSEQEGAQVELNRALVQMDKGKYQSAIRHFGFCIRPFEKEECMEELIKSSGMMGVALYECGLPYSAEAYLVKSASLLLKSFYIDGTVPHLLMTVMQKLCEIELMLGRIVMFLNWYELMMMVSQNGDYAEDEQFKEANIMHDCAWACRFAASDLKDESISMLPPVLERMGMFSSSEYLKYVLGYGDEIEEQMRKSYEEDGWQEKMVSQPIFKQFLSDLNVSHGEFAELQTTVRNCTLHVKYNNTCQNQVVAEILLGILEALLATMEVFEVVVITPDVYITIENTKSHTQFEKKESPSDYILKLASAHSDAELWECLAMFISCFFCRNAMTKDSIETLLESKQSGEKLMDRVCNLTYVKQSVTNVLGDPFKCKIEDWCKSDDKFYPMKNESFVLARQLYRNEKQTDTTFHSTNKDMSIWEGAGWQGCGFAFDQCGTSPPIFGLAFENIERGRQIVDEWKDKLPTKSSAVVIYIVRGINKNHPSWYRICVAPNVNHEEIEEGRYFTTMCRKHTMTPTNTTNLDSFERLYKAFNGCRFTAFALDPQKQIVMPPSYEGSFWFYNIEFRNAWEIGVCDMAKIAIEADDDPFVPEDKKDAASVIEVLWELKKAKQNFYHGS